MIKRVIACVLLSLIFVGAGCGKKLPQMSYEQEEAIVDYAAAALMQHVENNNSRLVDLSLYDTPETETEETEPVGMDPVADTPVIDASIGENQLTVDEVLAIENMELQYNSYEVLDTYPNEKSSEMYFSMDATKGKKFLVIHFTLQNLSDEEKVIDFISLMPNFVITVNGENKANALSTMLLDDLSTYAGKLEAKELKNMVLIVEIEQEYVSDIQSLQLSAATENGNCKITLVQ